MDASEVAAQFAPAQAEALTKAIGTAVGAVETRVTALEAKFPSFVAGVEGDAKAAVADVGAMAAAVKTQIKADVKAFFGWLGGLLAKTGGGLSFASVVGYGLHSLGWLKFIGL